MNPFIHYNKGNDSLCGTSAYNLTKRSDRVNCPLCLKLKPVEITKQAEKPEKKAIKGIPESVKEDVYLYWKNSEFNSASIMAVKFGLSVSQIHKILTNKTGSRVSMRADI